MNLWIWLAVAAALICVVVLVPVLIAFWRGARAISNVNSSEFRLKLTNCWTEIQHTKEGGSSQIMKLKDGYFVMLSVGLNTAKVFVAPSRESIESFVEVASFPIRRSGANQHKEGEAILNKLRPAIAWPDSVDELQRTLTVLAEKKFSPEP